MSASTIERLVSVPPSKDIVSFSITVPINDELTCI